MAFFDMLSKTVTEASQKTIAKTKEIADTSRLNSMISEEEKKLTNQFLRIGKLYSSLHKEDYEEEFSEMIGSINDAETKIKAYKKQIQDIKGIQHCEKCGAEVTNGAAFCSSCGATMPKVQDTVSYDVVKCENCGTEVKKGMSFCTACGKPMDANSVVLPVEDTISETVFEMNCPNCGEKVEPGMEFCTECGTKL